MFACFKVGALMVSVFCEPCMRVLFRKLMLPYCACWFAIDCWRINWRRWRWRWWWWWRCTSALQISAASIVCVPSNCSSDAAHGGGGSARSKTAPGVPAKPCTGRVRLTGTDSSPRQRRPDDEQPLTTGVPDERTTTLLARVDALEQVYRRPYTCPLNLW